MRRLWIIPVGAIAAVLLALWGVWTWRMGVVNRDLAFALEAERQRNFNDMAYHVEQIQSLLGKGLVTGTTRQNMRYMSDVHHHAMGAVKSFTSLPLPAQLSAATGKFLQQTGDFAQSILRNEAAGRDMEMPQRVELGRLRDEAVNLSTQLQSVMTEYNKGGFRWNPPVQFSWANLTRGPSLALKPPTGEQAPASLTPGGFDQIGTAMDKLPTMLYDGPFSDHVADRKPAMSGPPISREEATRRMQVLIPGAQEFRVAAVAETGGNLPTFSLRLTPAVPAAPGTPTDTYTAFAEITQNGGHLAQWLNSRVVGNATVNLARARTIGQEYLAGIGYRGMVPTYGQVTDGAATIAYAYSENGTIVYPDQIKLKIALDTGEVMGLDARQYLMSHHARNLGQPALPISEAYERLNPSLEVQRVQMALIPNLAGTGELLTYEFLTTYGEETFLVYINASTGDEEQIMQLIQSDTGTLTL